MKKTPEKKKIPAPLWIILWPFALIWLLLKKLADILCTVLGALWSLLCLPFRPGREIHGEDYEYCAAAWLAGRGYRHISLTKHSGDYGVDILCRRHGRRYAVQCKLYSFPVGVKAVQEVAAGMAHYDCSRAIVITNSTFTQAARTLAEDHNITLFENIPYRRGLDRRGRRMFSVSDSQ